VAARAGRHVTLVVMQLCDVFLAQGEDGFAELLRRVSMSRLRTFQLFEQIKTRLRLVKLNSEHLRKAEPRLWERLKAREEALAGDLAQAILVSYLDMIIEALNLLGIPHQDGFFSKDSEVKQYLTEGWQAKLYDALKDKYPPAVVVFYINHLGVDAGHVETLFAPAAAV
jgi:hypothetical protein